MGLEASSELDRRIDEVSAVESESALRDLLSDEVLYGSGYELEPSERLLLGSFTNQSVFEPEYWSFEDVEESEDYGLVTHEVSDLLVLRGSGRLRFDMNPLSGLWGPRGAESERQAPFDFGDLMLVGVAEAKRTILRDLMIRPAQTVLDGSVAAILDMDVNQMLREVAEAMGEDPEEHGHPDVSIEAADAFVAVDDALMNVAHQYLSTALPFLHAYPVELVLEWADELNDSIVAYRALVHELLTGAEADLVGADAPRLLDHIGSQLQAQYDDLVKQISSHSVWKRTRENLPLWTGRMVIGVVPTLFVGAYVALLVAGTVTIGTGLQTALQAMMDGFKLRDEEAPMNPAYWRYRMSPENWEQLPTWWTE